MLTDKQWAHVEEMQGKRVSRVVSVVTARDDAGNEFTKIAHLAEHDLNILCFGGPCQYRFENFDLTDKRDLSIDIGGRNHKGSRVFIKNQDHIRILNGARQLRDKLKDQPLEKYDCCPSIGDLKSKNMVIKCPFCDDWYMRESNFCFNCNKKVETYMQPLFPEGKRIEVLGLTGEFASGKTLFGLLLSPEPGTTLLYDVEKSAGTYHKSPGNDHGFPFDRVDVPSEMLKLKPKGWKPEDVYVWWKAHIRSVTPGKYRVIGLDPVSEIESGLADYVMSHPGEFGKTAEQYKRSAGLFWGDVKEAWKMDLTDIASRCQCFYFTSHMSAVFAGSAPVPGKRKAKGKETLMELASLYLQLERKPDAAGNKPAKPSAIVMKDRLALTRIGADGEPEIIPILPPRLPVATPAEIRKYMITPPDYRDLKPGERAPIEQVSEDDRAATALMIAEAQRETAVLNLEISRAGAVAIPHGAGAGSGRGIQTSPEINQQAFRAAPVQSIPASVRAEFAAAQIPLIEKRQPWAREDGDPGIAASLDRVFDPAQIEREKAQLDSLNPVIACLRHDKICPDSGTCRYEKSCKFQNTVIPGQAAHMVCDGFKFPATSAIVGYINEVQTRGTFEEIAPLFAQLPPAMLDWERNSLIVAICLHTIRVAKQRAHLTRLQTWLGKQQGVSNEAKTTIVKASAARWDELIPF